jgi:hypothetical protein
LTRSRFNTAAVPTTQLRKRLSNGIRKQTDTDVYLTGYASMRAIDLYSSSASEEEDNSLERRCSACGNRLHLKLV